MNKKLTLLFLACFALLSSASAQYNLFNPADVDADGWLWLDTQAKIDKYVGQSNNEDGTYDPNGKLIQLVDAVHGLDYISSEADAEFVGAGTDGEIGGPGARIGGIKIAPNTGPLATNGGGVVIGMPSCTAFNVALSSDARIFLKFIGTSNIKTIFSDYSVIDASHASGAFSPLAPAGQTKWENMENLKGTMEPFFEIKSSTPIYGMIQNMNKYDLYIHGIKVLTSTQGASIGGESMNSSISFDGKIVTTNEPATINIYNVAGTLVASEYTNSMNLSNLAKGIYIVKANQETAKIAIR